MSFDWQLEFCLGGKQLRQLLASAQAAVYEGAGPAWDATKKGAGELIAAAEPHLETATKHASETLSKVHPHLKTIPRAEASASSTRVLPMQKHQQAP